VKEPQEPPPLSLQQARDTHLKLPGDLSGRIEWLEKCVIWSSERFLFHQDLAIAHRQTGNLTGSLARGPATSA